MFFWGNNTTKAKKTAKTSAERAPLKTLACNKLVKLYKEFGMLEAEKHYIVEHATQMINI